MVDVLIGEYGLSQTPQAVRLIAQEGLTTVGLLATANLKSLVSIGLKQADARRVLLSAWLHSRGLGQYGPTLVQHGVANLPMCVARAPPHPHAAHTLPLLRHMLARLHPNVAETPQHMH